MHLNAPSLTTSKAEAVLAASKLQDYGRELSYNANGKYTLVSSTSTKNIYFFMFEEAIPAKSLNRRIPQIYVPSERTVNTQNILPPTSEEHVDVKFLITTDNQAACGQIDLNQGHKLLDVIGEDAKNSLLCHTIKGILEPKDWIVTTNKSVMIRGEATLEVSLCHTSKPDLIAFKPSKSIIMILDDLPEDLPEEEEIAETKILVTENKDEENKCTQQLLGGVEKALGETFVKFTRSNARNPIIYHVDVYALTLHHKKDECIVRKVTIDFRSNNGTQIVCGDTPLTKDDALNRIIAKLV